MDRHVAMQCYCRIVETGSFAAAARDLDVSASVVTKYVQFLEDWTGNRLLARTTRAMQPTDAGRRFYEYCRRVAADTDATLADLRSASGRLEGRLVVACPVSLTLAWLDDALHAFQAAHPGIELELRLSDRPADLVRDGVDVALRGQAQLEDSTLVAVPLATMPRVVCAAPAYWQRRGRPATPDDLEPADCLPYVIGRDAYEWRFEGPAGVATVAARGRFRSDNSLALLQAARRGLGVVLLPQAIARADLRAARLQTALEDWRAEPRRLYAVYPSREHLPEKTRRLVAFLRERLGAEA